MIRLGMRFLGGFAVERDGALITSFKSDKVRALLAYLAVEADRAHRRERLAALLWPGYPDTSARTNLRNALTSLRTVIGDREVDPPFLWIQRDILQFNAESDHRLDVAVVEVAARHAEQGSTEELLEAATLYRGEFLAGFMLADAVGFDDWAGVTRERLQRRILDLLGALVERLVGEGDVEGAIAQARRRVALAPWFEVGQRQLMGLLAAAGQRSAALRQYEACRAVLQEELGAAPSARTEAVRAQVLAGERSPGLGAGGALLTREKHAVGPCPYRGLSAFREADAPYFFGREGFVGQLAEALVSPPLLAGPSSLMVVVGPSGSGKSSVVVAGLLPQLREHGDWYIVSLRPGGAPFQALASALLPGLEPAMTETARLIEARRLGEALAEDALPLVDVLERVQKKTQSPQLLVLVDQFEELYTLCSDPQVRRHFIDGLLETAHDIGSARHQPEGVVALLLTLRADFMGQALAYRPFADALQSAVRLLGPMTREELRAAIEKPAAAQGAVFERGLVARLLDDVGEEPGHLPLLEFALTLLWERLDGGWLTHTAYEAIGGVEGALARYAEEVYASLTEAERDLCRRVFTQLVQPGEGTADTRRVATREEVGDSAWGLVRHLADRRLVVTDRDAVTEMETVEVIHEALIQHWGRLQGWMAADRAFRTWQERLRISVRTWAATEHDEGVLLRGVPLVEAEGWLADRGPDLSGEERAFVEASLALREARARRELEARERTLRQAAIGLAAEARNQMRGPGQDVAVLLALEAVARYPYTWQAELALAEVILDYPLVWQYDRGIPVLETPIPSPDGGQFLIPFNDGRLQVWDLRTYDCLLDLQAYEGKAGNYHEAYWSPSGDRILTVSWGEIPRIWDAARGDLLAELRGHGGGYAAWSPDGDRVLSCNSASEDAATIWDAQTGQVIHSFPGHKGVLIWAHFSPDGLRVATSMGEIYDAATGELLVKLHGYDALLSNRRQLFLTWSPDGGAVAGGVGEMASIWDAVTGDELHRLYTGHPINMMVWWSSTGDRLLTVSLSADSPAILWDVVKGSQICTLADSSGFLGWPNPWSSDGNRILLSERQGRVGIWDAKSGQSVLILTAHEGAAQAAWHPNGKDVISAGSDDKVRIWRVSSADLHVGCRPHCSFGPIENFSRPPIWAPDGGRVARGYSDGTVRVWSTVTGAEVLRFQKSATTKPPVPVHFMGWCPDGDRIATGAHNGDVEIWDAAMGERLVQTGGHKDIALGIHWSPDGERLLTCSRGRRAIIWDAATGDALVEFTGQDFFWGAWSPDGKRVVLVDHYSYRGPVRIWDAATGDALLTLLPEDFGYGTSGVAWSPDGTRIVTFSYDKVGRIWDARTGERLASFVDPGNTITAEWSPMGNRIMANGSSIRIWNAETLDLVATYPGEGEETFASWSPDGTRIAISYWNGDLKVYPAWQSLDDLVAYARSHCVLRDLTPEERARFGLPEG